MVDDYRYNIECDDSFNEELCNAATGYVIKDVGGRMVAAGCAACSADNPVLAEGLAILSGLSRMKTESWEGARICRDSKQRADIVNNKALAPWFLKSLYRDILSLVSETKAMNCLHIKRQCNGNAHRLAKWGRVQGVSSSWGGSFGWAHCPSLL